MKLGFQLVETLAFHRVNPRMASQKRPSLWSTFLKLSASANRAASFSASPSRPRLPSNRMNFRSPPSQKVTMSSPCGTLSRTIRLSALGNTPVSTQ